VFGDLPERYQQPSRYYHTLQHIDEMLTRLDAIHNAAAQSPAVAIAVWFHDAVYDTRRTDNEERSADLARACLAGWGVTDDLTGRVGALIMVTKHGTTLPADHEGRLISDLDLAILAAPAERYDRYASDIRREYAWVPDADYKAGRAVVLRRFVDRTTLFLTDAMSGADAAARANLTRELGRLAAQ